MQLFKGNEAEKLLNNDSFKKEWMKILNKCPWSTIFQSPEFVINWYRNFPSYQRIVLLEKEKETYTGMLFLTQDQNGTIVGAGTNMAEYQGWICKPENNSFPLRALETLTKLFPNNLIQMKYVLDDRLSVEHKRNIGSWHSMILVQHVRPLMENQLELLERELKKKNRKEKLNRLNRLGKLEYERIEEISRFEKVLPSLVLQNDLRKGAMYGKTAFVDEPERCDFLVDLFKLGLVHVSVLKVNDEIIASNVGIMGDGKVYLQGLNTISPYYTKYSPGILHFLILGKHLAEENIPEFDLTPGGTDGYKSMLATRSLHCYELIVGNYFKIFGLLLRQKVKEWLQAMGISKSFSNSLSEISRLSSFWSNIELRKTYEFHALSFEHPMEKGGIKINVDPALKLSKNGMFSFNSGSLEGLFSAGKMMAMRWRRKFYQDCLKRMEIGQKFHAIHFNGECVGIIWFWKGQEMNKIEIRENEKLFCEYSFVKGISKVDRMGFAKRILSIEEQGREFECMLLT
jgi:CelD/BcsL family acetyltransferase involved in cellulose biosynthesis